MKLSQRKISRFYISRPLKYADSFSRRNVWCDIFAGRAGNRDLGRFSLSFSHAYVTTTRLERQTPLKLHRHRQQLDSENVLSARSTPAGYPGYFSRIWIHVYQLRPRLTRSLFRSASSPAESFTRFLALSHFSVTNFAIGESSRYLWGGATTPTRFQERIVARKSPSPRSRRYIFPRNKIDLSPYSSEQLPPRASRVRDRIVKLQLAFGICEANWITVLTVMRNVFHVCRTG